ncbi:MAG: hypothetical protein U0797_03195 [Gemmataceae bacterium]
MQRHRFREQLAKEEMARRQPTVPQGFVMCPMALTQGWQGQTCPWEEVYKLALERAQAVVRPSRLERLQNEIWN